MVWSVDCGDLLKIGILTEYVQKVYRMDNISFDANGNIQFQWIQASTNTKVYTHSTESQGLWVNKDILGLKNISVL